MSQIRLLIDEDAQRRGLARSLRAAGVDVVTVNEAGLAGAVDEELLRNERKFDFRISFARAR